MGNDYEEVMGGEGIEDDDGGFAPGRMDAGFHEDDDDVFGSEADAWREADDASGDLVEHGYEMPIHGGGTIEAVSGFDENHAMTEGLGGVVLPVDPTLNALPRSCDIEYGPEPESVCGRDDRVQVGTTARIPWRYICQLIITLKDGRRSRCTGWFISPRTVMTAGHCVYSHTAGGWATSIEVIPGMNAATRPFGSATGRTFYSVKGWTRNRKPTHDYGCVLLPPSKPLGRKTGWFGFASLADGSLKRLLVNNSGYPGDKAFGTQWYNAGRITRADSRKLFYMLDTAGGQSGSPVWRLSQGRRHAVGVHAYGGCPNSSTRINPAVFRNMKSWKAKGL